MKFLHSLAALALSTVLVTAAPPSLFDGKTLAGWEGETNQVWRVRDGVIVGGSLTGNPRNEFLATTKKYHNFDLRLQYQLVGTEGFVNSGVQFRSKRVASPSNEMSGFQADIGAGFSGCLYDESRRNKTLVFADTNLVVRLEKTNDWNDYEIRAEGVRIRIFLNGTQTVDYIEREPGIDADGLIALQIHGNNKAEVSFREITIEEFADALVPSEPEILSRFGDASPGAPLPAFTNGNFTLGEHETIALAGQENFVREQKSGELESLLASAFSVRAPRFRSMAWEADTVYDQWRDLNFGSWTSQLESAGATIVVAQFGQIEALDGPARLPEFTARYGRLLDQFTARTRRLVLVSPMPFEQPAASHAPDLTLRNGDVGIYVEAVRAIAQQHRAVFVDLFTPLSTRLPNAPRLTDDGIHLNETGLRDVAQIIAGQLGAKVRSDTDLASLREAIVEKNRLWFDCLRPANWSFAYGDRVSQPFGQAGGNSPSLRETFEHYKPLIAQSEERIHALARGENSPKDSRVSSLAPSEGERVGERGPLARPVPGEKAPAVSATPAAPAKQEEEPLSPEAELATFTMAEGYEVNLFASEHDGVVKPTQIAWDERGRLYVACSPTYPQRLASAKPADYVLALEDTKGSGRVDKVWRYAEGLTMVEGLEPGASGLYVCDFDQILHLRDTDGDGRADERTVLFSGFGIGDTHQLVNSITHGPDGSLWFTQGLHAFSRVETPWGLAQLDRAGVWRLRPRTARLDGFFSGGMAGANCWGVVFDDYGQMFHKSGDRPQGYWSQPGLVRLKDPEDYHPVGAIFDTSPKTTSLEIIGTQALPDDVQGCAVIGGYFGNVVELHRFHDDGSGFSTTQLPKLMKSTSTAFRPVDVSVGPDGAIYVADWFNPVIGHYQASYADPHRDKSHGRIWRITAKGRKLVKQPKLARLTPDELLEQLRSPERWTRYQAKRLLFDAPTSDVMAAADKWEWHLDPTAADYEHLLLEVIGVYEAHETVRPDLLAKLLAAKDPRVRAYGTRVISGWADRLADPLALLRARIHDENPRVRLEAIVAASYVLKPESVEVITEALDQSHDRFIDYALTQSARALQPQWEPELAANHLTFGGNAAHAAYIRALAGKAPVVKSPGRQVYEMACLPCHQPEGKGLPGVYPSLVGSDWVRGDSTRVIKIVLSGLAGPLKVNGEPFVQQNPVQMPSMAGMTDQQIADVINYVRGEFGAGAVAVPAEEVKAARAVTARREMPWTEYELLRELN